MKKQRSLADVRVWGECLPERLHDELLSALSFEQFERWYRDGLPFYRTTFWYPSGHAPAHVIERAIDVLREAVKPSSRVIGVEWWFSVLRTNQTPQWLLPCHFDRANLDEKDPSRIRHPEWASVLFFNDVPYGELCISDQVLSADGNPAPAQPRDVRFVPPAENRYAVFPGHLYHGVIGRMWRAEVEECLRVTMAVNWWTHRPTASYLRDSISAPEVFGLGSDPVG